MTKKINGMFKKTISTVVMGAVLALCLIMAPQDAANAAANVKVVINGVEVQFPDQKPYINEDNRTMVPVRAPMEAIGCTVDWDGVKRQAVITRGETTATFTIGSKDYTVNGVKKTMDTSAVITNDRTSFPIRFCAEAFGAKVGWEQESQTVTITTNDNVAVGPGTPGTPGTPDKPIVPPVQGDNKGNIVQATPEQIEELRKTDRYWSLLKTAFGKNVKSHDEMTEADKDIAWGILDTGIIKPGQTFVTDRNLSYYTGNNSYVLEGYLTYKQNNKESTVRYNVHSKYVDGKYTKVDGAGYSDDGTETVVRFYL